MFLFNLINLILDFVLNNILCPIFIVAIILIFQLIIYFSRNKAYLSSLEKFRDPKDLNIEDLNSKPLINFIIPAWKEKKYLKKCLYSIRDLKYPSVKVIINAGGDSETINIAESFKKYDNFVILYQSGGEKSAALGKIKAINECLTHVDEGIIYSIDADSYITDDILMRMIYPIINGKESVVISSYRPLKEQQDKEFTKYLQISRTKALSKNLNRYSNRIISGSNTCFSYEVLKDIGKFTVRRALPTEVSRAMDILNQGYKIYGLIEYEGKIYSAYPNNLKDYADQRNRYFQNRLVLSSYKGKHIPYIKFLVLIMLSIYLILSPLLLLFSLNLFLFAILIIYFKYLTKLRQIFIFKKIVVPEEKTSFSGIFFIKMIYYIIIEHVIDLINFPKVIRHFFKYRYK